MSSEDASWTRTSVIAAMQAWRATRGRAPTVEQWRHRTAGHPSAGDVARMFGSWSAAVTAAELPADVHGEFDPQEAILEAFHAWADTHDGLAPRSGDWGPRLRPEDRGLYPAPRKVRRYFGSWDAACRYAGLTQRPPERTYHDAPFSEAWGAERILLALRTWADEHDGVAPRLGDWHPSATGRLHPDYRADRTRWPSAATVVRVFGSWQQACRAAELDQRASRQGRRSSRVSSTQQRWDEQTVLGALRAWQQRYGRPPRRRDWLRSGPGHPEGGVVYRIFGSWPAALIAAGLDAPAAGAPQRPGGWDFDAIVEAIEAWTERFGEPPTVLDWNPSLARARGEHPRADRFDRERPRWPVSAAVGYHCGSWNAALAAAHQRTTVRGLKRESPRPTHAHHAEHTHAWTHAEALDAIGTHRRWFGRNPTYDAWCCGDPDGLRPSTRTVLRLFGSWNTAIALSEAHPHSADTPPLQPHSASGPKTATPSRSVSTGRRGSATNARRM